MSRRMPRSLMSCSASSQSWILPAPWARAWPTSAASCSGHHLCPAGQGSACRSSGGSSSKAPGRSAKPLRPSSSTLNESLSAVHFSFTGTLDEGALRDARPPQRPGAGTGTGRHRSGLITLWLPPTAQGSHRRSPGHHPPPAAGAGGDGQPRTPSAHPPLQHGSQAAADEGRKRPSTKKRLTIQKHKLFLDSLTQVHNRAALDERLELEYKRWLRYGTHCAWPSSTSRSSSTSTTTTATWPATRP